MKLNPMRLLVSTCQQITTVKMWVADVINDRQQIWLLNSNPASGRHRKNRAEVKAAHVGTWTLPAEHFPALRPQRSGQVLELASCKHNISFVRLVGLTCILIDVNQVFATWWLRPEKHGYDLNRFLLFLYWLGWNDPERRACGDKPTENNSALQCRSQQTSFPVQFLSLRNP